MVNKQNMYLVVIVAVVALVGFFMMFSGVSFSSANDLTGLPVAVTCTDSDGGLTYNTFGTVTRGSATYSDICNTGTVLKERYCTTTGYVNTQMYNCAAVGKVCQNGACVATSGTCTDSDGGNNVNVAGTTTGPMSSNGPVQTNTDQCYNIYTDDGSGETTSSCTPSSANGIICQVREYYCNNGVVAINDQQLAVTQGCTNGAAVQPLPDLIGDEASGSFSFLSGTVNVVGGNVQPSSYSLLTTTYTCAVRNQGAVPAVGTSRSSCSFYYGAAPLYINPTNLAPASALNLAVNAVFNFRQATTATYINAGGGLLQLLQNIYNTGSSQYIVSYNIDAATNPSQRITESNEANNQQSYTKTIGVGGLMFNNVQCVPPTTGCPLGQYCNGNICVQGECSTNTPCPTGCFCNLGNYTCYQNQTIVSGDSTYTITTDC